MGLRPAPPVGTRLGWEDGPLLSGDVIIDPGVGLFARTDGQQLLLDAVNAEPPQSLHHFHPGSLAAAGTLARFTNPGRSGSAILVALDVHLGTAPSAADETDHLVVRVAGTSAGELDLPLYPQGETRFSADVGLPTPVVGYDDSIKTSFSATINGGNALMGIAVPFAANANLTATALRFTVGNVGVAAGVRRIVSILDAQRQPIMEWSVWGEWDPGEQVTIPFPVELDVPQGQPLMWAIRVENDAARPLFSFTGSTFNNHSASDRFGWAGDWPYEVDDYFALPDDAWGTGTSRKMIIRMANTNDRPDRWHGRSWAEPVQNDISNQVSPMLTGDLIPDFALIAKPAGVLLTGDVTLSVVAEGTGGTPGEDANIRIQLQGLEVEA